MKFSVDMAPLPAAILDEQYRNGERSVTRAMGAWARSTKAAWRSDVVAAGLGRRLSNTIRSDAYPKGTDSLNAAAQVWSNAPHIVGAFEEGALISSADGFWLAIPLPAAGRGRGNRRTNPGDFEQRTGMRLRFVYRSGRSALLVAEDARLNARGQARRKGGRRRKTDGILTGSQSVPVFVLVPQVRLAKRLDLYGIAERQIARLPQAVVSGWRD